MVSGRTFPPAPGDARQHQGAATQRNKRQGDDQAALQTGGEQRRLLPADEHERQQKAQIAPHTINGLRSGLGLALGSRALDVGEKADQDPQRRKQVGAADDVGHRLGGHRVSAEQRRHEKGRPKPFHQHQHRKVNQHRVRPVQDEVDPVVAGGVRPIAEGAVVEQIRQRRQRTVQAADGLWPPVVLGENQVKIVVVGIPQARVLENDELVVQREPCVVQRVAVREQHDGTEHERDRHMRKKPGRWPQPGFRSRFRLGLWRFTGHGYG